jgi:hypothetical protein
MILNIINILLAGGALAIAIMTTLVPITPP